MEIDTQKMMIKRRVLFFRGQDKKNAATVVESVSRGRSVSTLLEEAGLAAL